jgi:hypothetical protein
MVRMCLRWVVLLASSSRRRESVSIKTKKYPLLMLRYVIMAVISVISGPEDFFLCLLG